MAKLRSRLHKDILKDLKKSYEVLDDVRARLENINDDIRIEELDDKYHSFLSVCIEEWLADIESLDGHIDEWLPQEEIK